MKIEYLNKGKRMNLSEFKAWFEGFTENMKQTPSAKAWARVKEKVSEITEKPAEIRWIPMGHYYYPYYYYTPTYPSTLCGGTSTYQGAVSTLGRLTQTNETTTTIPNEAVITLTTTNGFSKSTDFFNALGHADASAL